MRRRSAGLAQYPAANEQPGDDKHMVILLNGPLGIGKSTLAEALAESLDGAVMLDGDQLIAMTPAPADEVDYLHGILALLIGHHRAAGYRHFVISHLWRTAEELADLRRRLLAHYREAEIRCFLLQLPLDENLRRIERRQSARALDEAEFESRTVLAERELLFTAGSESVGEPFDASASPEELVAKLLITLGIDGRTEP